jgi:hypothetical protein
MLEGMQPEKKLAPCGVRKLYYSLEGPDRQILLDALNDHILWTTSDLEKALRDRGAKISYSVLRKHRHSDCSCKVGWHSA